MRSLARICTALVLLAVGVPSFAVDPSDEKVRAVDRLFERWNRSDSPGCSLGIVRDGRLIYERGYGMANLEHEIPIDSSTVFRIASVSKQFTAAAALLLQQAGALALDDDIRAYLPEMPDYGRPITIRHLMHHSSGIRDYAEVMYLLGVADEDTYVEQEVLQLLARQRALNFAPGERYLYSNSGYVLLGEIVERVSGQTLRKFVAERIFQPLGMNDSLIRDDHHEWVAHRAAGYAPLEAGGFRIAESNYDLVGDGSIFTTVRDLARWDHNFYEPRVGGDEVVAAQHATLVLNDGRPMSYAAGLEVATYGGLRVVAHSGSWVGFKAQLMRFPEQRFSVICLCNDESANPTALALRIADIYLANQFTSPPARPVVTDPSVGRSAPTAADLAAKEGLYRDPVSHTIARIRADGADLRVDLGWRPARYAPIDPHTFRSADPDVGFPSDLVFGASNRAKAKRFQLLQFGEVPLAFERVAPHTPTVDELREYVGTYTSSEVDTTHEVVLENGKLYLAYRRSPRTPLRPSSKDGFTLDAMRVEFERDASGCVAGYGVWFDTSWNLRFTRQGGGCDARSARNDGRTDSAQ